MNRKSALNILFAEPEAGNISGDEPRDSCEKASDVDDEIEIDYNATALEQVLTLEQELINPNLEHQD